MTVNVRRKSRENRVWFELARVRVIGSRLYFPGYIFLENRRQNLKLNGASSRYLLFIFALLYFVLFCFSVFILIFSSFFFFKIKS